MAVYLLTDMSVGSKVRLNAIKGDKALSRRLLSLGISLGSQFEIINQRGKGVVVAREGNRVAFGASIANKLLVEEISDQ